MGLLFMGFVDLNHKSHEKDQNQQLIELTHKCLSSHSLMNHTSMTFRANY